MKSLLLENRVGGQYPNIHKISKGLKDLYIDDNCCLVSNPKKDETILIFPLKFQCISNSNRPQSGGFASYEFIIKQFIRRKVKSLHLECSRVHTMESNFFMGSKNVYIACRIVHKSYYTKSVKFKIDDFFNFFSENFKENIKELECHILDNNPYRYKYIY